jgi:single-strand DNA-binding protein
MSASLNKCFLIGNCTRDPELRHTPKGTAICELGLAINRTWTDEDPEPSDIPF